MTQAGYTPPQKSAPTRANPPGKPKKPKKNRKRKKGIGLAMTQAVMREAKKYGARFAVLQSSPDGYRVYRRAGFEQQCQVEVYGLQGA